MKSFSSCNGYDIVGHIDGIRKPVENL